MTTLLENIELLSALLTMGAPILLGLSAAAYLAVLLSWPRVSSSVKPRTRNLDR